MQQRIFLIFALVGALSLVFSGCNSDSKYAKVEGTITYNGQTVEGATVTFMPDGSTGESAAGLTDAGGKFTLTSSQAAKGGTGALPGQYIVLVSKITPPPPDPDDVAFQQGSITYEELQQRKSAKSMRPVARPQDEVPSRYGSPVTTDLRATVEKGKNAPFNFGLTD